MNSDVEKFIKGESKNSYNYFGAHKVNDGVCFRLYAPHAKAVEVKVGETNQKLEKVDFRGVYETRAKDIKEFDTYQYEILTNDDAWITKNDPYSFYSDSNKSMFVEEDNYTFNDDKWYEKQREITYLNICVVDENFRLDDQRAYIDYLKKYNYNYVILKPYDPKYLFSVNKQFINESSLKTFIENLHLFNIGVIFDFDFDCFYDYSEGLNDFDGANLYNVAEEKYKDVNQVYFDLEKNHTKSYVLSFVNYYMELFHGDGVYTTKNEMSSLIENTYPDKLFIYKDNVNYKAMDEIIELYNKGFDYKEFLNIDFKSGEYLYFDYKKCLSKIKGNEELKKNIADMLLCLAYISNCYIINTYNEDKDYLERLQILTDIYKTSRILANKDTKKLLLNGKKHDYFAYEYSHRNDYLILFVNFSEESDDKFDIGMPFYGYYNIALDSLTGKCGEEPLFTRTKKAQNKELAMQFAMKPHQAVVFQRLKDI